MFCYSAHIENLVNKWIINYRMDCKTQLAALARIQSVGRQNGWGGDFVFIVLLLHFFFADFVMTVNLSILKCWLVSFIIYLFICIYLVGWEGACKKSVCVGDLQSVFHKLFICIYLVGWEGTCKKSCLCWRSVRNEDRQLLWRVWAGKVHAKKAVYVGDL